MITNFILYFKVFSRLNKEQSPDYSKLKWIEGDLRKVNLGLSHENITKLQSSVNMIIHSAATVKFNAPLKDAIVTNISATNDLLNIASGCENFDVSCTKQRLMKNIYYFCIF